MCDRAVVKAGAVVEGGSILSYGVVVGPRHTVPPHTRASLCQQSKRGARDSDEEELEYARDGGARASGACVAFSLFYASV